MTAIIYDRSTFFAQRRLEADVTRIRGIADRAAAEQRTKTDAARHRVERQLTTIISGCDWFERAPSDCEPFWDGRA